MTVKAAVYIAVVKMVAITTVAAAVELVAAESGLGSSSDATRTLFPCLSPPMF